MTDEPITLTRLERRVLEELERIEQPVLAATIAQAMPDVIPSSVGKICDNLAKRNLVNRSRHGTISYWQISAFGRESIRHLTSPSLRAMPQPPVPISGRALATANDRPGRIMVFGDHTLEQLADLLVSKVLPENPSELRNRALAQEKTIADLQARIRTLEADLEAANQLLGEQETTLNAINSALGNKGF